LRCFPSSPVAALDRAVDVTAAPELVVAAPPSVGAPSALTAALDPVRIERDLSVQLDLDPARALAVALVGNRRNARLPGATRVRGTPERSAATAPLGLYELIAVVGRGSPIA
jgi:hypothetical protein